MNTPLIALCLLAVCGIFHTALANPTATDVFHYLLENQLVTPTYYYDDNGVVNGTHFAVDPAVEAEAYRALGGVATNNTRAKRGTTNTVNCYCSGSWALQQTLSGAVPTICSHYNLGLHNGQQQYFSTGYSYKNEAGDTMKIVTTLNFDTPSSVSQNTCKDWFRRLIFWTGDTTNSWPCATEMTGCQGDHSDTRGGSLFTSDGVSDANVVIDPTTQNCNC